MLVKIEKNINSSYRNVMQKVLFIETEHIESMMVPGDVRMVSGASHKVGKEDFDLLFNILKRQSSTQSQAKP